jgi:formylglycine-generating enzyme required for sulfatase activity
MALVPAGSFTMGDTFGDGDPAEKPTASVALKAFWLDRFEVTFDQFAKFVQAGGYKPQGNWEQLRSRGGNHPVINVTWNDAVAYCRWADKSLPSEAEWEYAARGTEGRKYPWGNQWDPNRARFRGNKGTATSAPVGSYPNGASPFGIQDLAGNVWEWTASLEKPYPYVATDGREDLRTGGSRVTRGGSWLGDSEFLRATVRDFSSPTSKNDKLGFRCAQQAP